MRTKTRFLPQINEDMISLHNMVSPQNGDTRGGPPPSPPPPPPPPPPPLATPLSVVAILVILQLHLPLYCLGYSEKLFRSLRQAANCSLINHTLWSFTLSFSLRTIEYREVKTNLFSL